MRRLVHTWSEKGIYTAGERVSCPLYLQKIQWCHVSTLTKSKTTTDENRDKFSAEKTDENRGITVFAWEQMLLLPRYADQLNEHMLCRFLMAYAKEKKTSFTMVAIRLNGMFRCRESPVLCSIIRFCISRSFIAYKTYDDIP